LPSPFAERKRLKSFSETTAISRLKNMVAAAFAKKSCPKKTGSSDVKNAFLRRRKILRAYCGTAIIINQPCES